MEEVHKGFDEVWSHASEHKEITVALAGIGALYLTGKLLGKVGSFYKYFLRPSKDLKARYGDGWAIVTGASDGIGKAFALELASRGFNVGLVARNQEKLDAVSKEIKQKYKVKTQTIVFDFNVTYTEEKVKELKDKLNTFNKVSLLVNNVGIGIKCLFGELEGQKMIDLINVNVVGLTMVTKILLPKLLDTEMKGGIINIGSGTTTFVYVGQNVYASTKSYVNKLSESLAEEYKEKLDVLTATV
jgi:17beta-estradiol 17-dehydrogenase / very-long-chain 3-oxoacyl-CoA reductase